MTPPDAPPRSASRARRHRARRLALAFAAACVLGPRAALATRVHLELADGAAVDGELLDVAVGVRARVQLDDGSVREVRWPELRVVPPEFGGSLAMNVAVGPGAPHDATAAPSAATDPDDPAGWSTPRAGAVPVLLESTSDPLVLTGERRAPLCATPCLLYLHPGVRTFTAGGARLELTKIFLPVGDVPLRVALHAPPSGRGAHWALFGALGLLLGLGGTGIAVLAGTTLHSQPVVESPLFWGGTSAALVGFAGAVTGFIAAVRPARGIARIEPLWSSAGTPAGVAVTGGF